ncbi:unnamed protein product [Prunus armeniaca]
MLENEDETSLLLPTPSRSAVSSARKLPPASVLGNHEVEENTTIPINVGVVLDLETRLGKMGMSCIDMALSDFYSSHGYYSTRLILHTRDSMSDVVVAAAAALDLINNVEVQAIIGLESSMQASFVISLGDKAQVPIISFTATSPSLGGSYLFRIAQNDSSQAEAISTIIQAFGWSEAVLITIDSEFGLGVTPYLTTALHAVGVRIPYWSVISPMATDDQILVELYKLMKMQTRVFIVHILPSLGFRFFAKAKEVGMMDEGYVWIVTSGMANVFSSSNFSVIDNMQGVLGLKTYVPNTKELENFRARWQRKFQQDNPTIPDDKLNVFGLWAYDAAWALAMAVEKVAGTNFSFQKMNISPNSTYLGRLEVSQSGPQLAREISRTRFKGLSGDFSLIKGQLQSSTFQVINMNDNGERGVGFWTPQNGLVRKLNWNNTSTYSTSNANLGPIIWPGETMSTPKGWDIPAGSNLRVLVPVKMLFKEFVNVTYGPSSHTTTVAGYCIEVFEAVMKTLPYAVSYQFIPFATPNGESAGTYDELVNQVFLGKYDVAVGDISIRANRALYVDFTLPYTESGMSMIVPIKDNNNPRNTWVFLKPLTWDLWVTSGCFFIFIGFVVWVLEHRINEDFRGPPHHQVGTSLWFSFSTMFFAQRERVVSNLARFVVIIWCFVVLILIQSYTASLTSFLTVQQLQPTVTDVNQLMKNGDNVGYQLDSFVYETLKQVGFQEDKLKAFNSTQYLNQLFQDGIENDGISAAFGETPYLKLFLATYCSNYTMVGPSVKANGFGFVFQKGALLTREVSRAITLVREGDVMRHIEDKWFNKNASCSANLNTAAAFTNSLTLGLNSFWGLFLVAGVASSLALVIFVAMFLYENMHTLTCFDSKASLWRRILAVLRVYDQKELNTHTFKKRTLQEAVVHGIGAVESSPNINYSLRSSSNSISNPTESHIVLEELRTPSTERGDLNLNGQATQDAEYSIELASPSEKGTYN